MARPGSTDPDDCTRAAGRPGEPPGRRVDPRRTQARLWRCHERRGRGSGAERCHPGLDGVRPALSVSIMTPSWRARAGVNLNPGKLGKVDNDDQADWSAAWALFPWRRCLRLARRQVRRRQSRPAWRAASSMMRSQIIWAKDRFALSRGDYHWQHEPCWYAVRRNARGGWSGDRSQSTLWTIPSREDKRAWSRHAEAGGVHAAADRQQLVARAGRLRSLRRLRHDDHRRRDDRDAVSTRLSSTRPMSTWR